VSGVSCSRVGVSCTRLAVPGGLVTHRVRAVSLIDPVPWVIVCALAWNLWPGKKRVDQAFACEGADENSWQSRPQGDCGDLARVMLLLDVSTIARNVGLHLFFAASRCAEHSHDCVADTLPALQTALQTHYQPGRQQDFVPGMCVPRSGLPRVFVHVLA